MPAPDNVKYIVTQAHAGLSAEIVIPRLATDADMDGVGGAGTSEEYNTTTTGLTWNVTPDVVDSNTTRTSHLYVQDNGAVELLGTKAWVPGSGAFDARCKVAVGTEAASAPVSFGLIITSSSDTTRLLVEMQVLTANGRFEVGAYTYSGGSYTQQGALGFFVGANVAYLRITRDGSDNVNFFWSDDGYAWQSILASNLNFSITVANIGYRMLPASYILKGYVEWLRTSV